MMTKSKLPKGMNEFPPHIKRNRDRLRLIFKLVKSQQQYRQKCRMEGDALITKSIKYTINNVNSLPDDLAVYKAAQKEDEHHIAFCGEWSPYSNFHYSPFTVNRQKYHSSKQWIQ